MHSSRMWGGPRGATLQRCINTRSRHDVCTNAQRGHALATSGLMRPFAYRVLHYISRTNRPTATPVSGQIQPLTLCHDAAGRAAASRLPLCTAVCRAPWPLRLVLYVLWSLSPRLRVLGLQLSFCALRAVERLAPWLLRRRQPCLLHWWCLSYHCAGHRS